MQPRATAVRLELSTGITVSYVASGPDGTMPVLLLHAWGESRGTFDRLVPLLPDSVRTLAIDQRGHGDADAPDTGFSLADFAADVEAFMDALDVPSAVLVGVSSGGYVAQQVAITCPQRVAGLVLVGSPRTLQGRPSFADEIDQLRDPVPEWWVRDSLSWFPLLHDVPQAYVDARVRDGARLPARVWRETFDGLCAAEPPTDLGAISCPTLIVWGDQDELLSREHQDDLAAAIPDSQLVVYEQTGHLVLWEQPERVARDLTAFVERLARQAPASSGPEFVRPPRAHRGPIHLAPPDAGWPRQYAEVDARIRQALGSVAVLVEHVGSTSVPGLAAKPYLDVLLLVPDPGDEAAYVPGLEAAGFLLHVREPGWHQHRFFRAHDPEVQIHVFAVGSEEAERMLLFRDRLRANPDERTLYEETKRRLAVRSWTRVQDYADAKSEVVEEIIARARHGHRGTHRRPGRPERPLRDLSADDSGPADS